MKSRGGGRAFALALFLSARPLAGWCFRLRITMMRRVLVMGLVAAAGLLPGIASAQGTKLGTVERYDEMEKGTTEGVAIRSDGRLVAGAANALGDAAGESAGWQA